MDRLQRRINEIDPSIVGSKFTFQQLIDDTLYKTEKRVEASLKNITVMPKITASERERISSEYTKTMQLEIKNWTIKETQNLRKDMKALVLKGGRYESVIGEIQNRYQVSRSKAKFLARQETSLMMTKFKQVRYQSAGITEYTWECVKGSPAHPVRHYHFLNNGKTFKYSEGAVINAKGEKKNPGQDYNCRCIDRPHVRF